MNYNKFLLAIVLGLVTQLNIDASSDQGRGVSLIKGEEFSVSLEGYKQLVEKYIDVKSELENRFALGEHYHTTTRINDLVATIEDLANREWDMRSFFGTGWIRREGLDELLEKAEDEIVENLLRAEANVTGANLWRRVARVKKSMMMDEFLRKN